MEVKAASSPPKALQAALVTHPSITLPSMQRAGAESQHAAVSPGKCTQLQQAGH